MIVTKYCTDWEISIYNSGGAIYISERSHSFILLRFFILSNLTVDYFHFWSPALYLYISKRITVKLWWQALAPALNLLLPKAYLTVKSGSNRTFSAQMKVHI